MSALSGWETCLPAGKRRRVAAVQRVGRVTARPARTPLRTVRRYPPSTFLYQLFLNREPHEIRESGEGTGRARHSVRAVLPFKLRRARSDAPYLELVWDFADVGDFGAE